MFGIYVKMSEPAACPYLVAVRNILNFSGCPFPHKEVISSNNIPGGTWNAQCSWNWLSNAFSNLALLFHTLINCFSSQASKLWLMTHFQSFSPSFNSFTVSVSWKKLINEYGIRAPGDICCYQSLLLYHTNQGSVKSFSLQRLCGGFFSSSHAKKTWNLASGAQFVPDTCHLA